MVAAVLRSSLTDNPTQIPISQPIAFMFINAGLIFLPPVGVGVSQPVLRSDRPPGLLVDRACWRAGRLLC
jgi:hypothetical protein